MDAENHPTSPESEEWIDELGKKAGHAIRGTAPRDGAAALRKRQDARRRKVVAGAASGLALVCAATFVVTRAGDDDESLRVGDQTTQAPTTGAIDSSISASTLATAAPAPSTDASIPTTASTATTSASDEPLSAELEWGLDYVGGTPSAAAGEPFKVGWISSDSTDVQRRDALDATVEYINAELGGVRGQPIEVVRCDPAVDGGEVACAQQMAGRSDVPVVIPTSWFPAPDGLAAMPDQAVVSPFVLSPESIGGTGFSFATDPTTIALTTLAFAATAIPDATDIVLVGGNTLIDPEVFAGALPGRSLTVIDTPPGASPEQIVTAIQATPPAVDADVYVSVEAITTETCKNLPLAVQMLGSDAAVVEPDYCVVDGSGRELSAEAADGDALDGVYITSAGDPFDSTSIGYHLLNRVLQGVDEQSPVEADAPTFEALSTFLAVITLTKIVNEMPEQSTLDGPTIKQAIVDFRGAAILQHGTYSCGTARSELTGYSAPAICSDQLAVFQHQGGKWVPIANGLNGKIAGFSGVVDVDPALYPGTR
jgi:hypothetical protein